MDSGDGKEKGGITAARKGKYRKEGKGENTVQKLEIMHAPG